MDVVFATVLPVAAVVAVGYALGATRLVEAATLSNLALWVASPALLFSVLAGTELDSSRWASLLGGTLWIAAGTAVLAGGVARWLGSGRGFLLPAVFFNGGNLGLACARLAFGAEGLEAAAIVFVAIAVLTALFGVWIAKGENGLREALRLPLLYGAVGGLALALSGARLPALVMEPIEMLGAMAIPLMLLNLGVQLRRLVIRDLRDALAASAVRMGGGFAFALAFVALFDVSGVDRQVLLLDSVMPAAVMNAVIAERYGANPALVASAIVISTLASLIAIPLVLLYVT